MKFVILSHKQIPGYGVKGPILSPASYDIHLVLKWIAAGVDVREVMDDGSLRKLTFNDARLMEELNKKLDKLSRERERVKKARDDTKLKISGNVKLIPEAKPLPKKTKVKKQEIKEEPKQQEQPIIKEQPKKEEQIDLFIDQLEKPE